MAIEPFLSHLYFERSELDAVETDYLSTWKNCALVCKDWNTASQKTHPLFLAIVHNQESVVCGLLEKGCPSQMRILGSPSMDYSTPYLSAMEHNAPEIAAILREKEAGFSDRYIQMKLVDLIFDIGFDFSVNGVQFKEGLNHFVHHQYLVPYVYHSLQEFFSDYQESDQGTSLRWDEECTQSLLQALNASSPLCTACSAPPQGQSLYIGSDTNHFQNRHWINFVVSEKLKEIAVGNCGFGCTIFSGVRVYPCQNPTGDLKQLLRNALGQPHHLHIPMELHTSGSCSLKSFQATAMGTIYFVLREKYAEATPNECSAIARHLIKMWQDDTKISCLHRIMRINAEIDYDPDLLVRALASFHACPQTAQKFYEFLSNELNVDWNLILNKTDNKKKTPFSYISLNNIWWMSNVDFCFQPEQGINFIATQFNKNLEIKKEWLKSVYSHLPQLEKNLIQEIVCKKRHIPENAREEWAQDHLFDDILLFKSVIREIWQSKVDAIIEKILVK